METSDNSVLPLHVITDEILSRSSADTVARARSVCKEWNQETYKSNFARAFHQRHRGETVSGFLVQLQEKYKLRRNFVPIFDDGSEKKVSLSFLQEEEKTTVVAAESNQGLILCVKPHRGCIDDYIVSKPATQQWRKIPRPKTRYFSVKHAIAVMGSNPRDQLRYKILRFSKPNSDSFTPKSWVFVHRCEIFDSATWAWKALPKLLSLRYSEFLDNSEAVSVSGFAYCLTTDKRVVALAWESESLHLIDLPEATSNGHRLVEWEGKLGLAFVSDDRKHMELWAYVSKVWIMKMRTSLECLESYGYCHSHPLAMLCRNIAVVAGSDRLSFLKLGLSADRVLKMNKRAFRIPFYDHCFWIESDHVVVNMNKTQAHTASLVNSDHQPRSCYWTPLLLISICFLVIFTFLYALCV